ncbi:hypothetical protein [Parasedimentitalea huanghaiensis]|uniref:Uncharacterized protein n=1 Tax=Parasedimentitalea huanghaiensis TaxID=2682100 RepID=A0A6L6WBX8_9RHOB|nr:hypothetical protein [Zongyanglinia huanghaiensis]MVO15070.1 hypothetical protein [Zongyanglinia huanghaiensis]
MSAIFTYCGPITIDAVGMSRAAIVMAVSATTAVATSRIAPRSGFRG